MRQHVRRGHSNGITTMNDLSGASYILWAPVPLNNEGSPWPSAAAWLGDFRTNTQYRVFLEGFQIMATAAGHESLGGWLLKVNAKSKGLYSKVIKAVAAEGLYVPELDEAVRKATVRKHAHKTAYFSPEINDAVEEVRAKIRSRQRDNDEVNAESGNRRMQQNVAHVQEVTIVAFGSCNRTNDPDFSEVYRPEKAQDGYTAAEREEKQAQLMAATGDGEVVDRTPITADDAGQADTYKEPEIKPKWRVFCIALPRAPTDAASVTDTANRSTFHQSLGAEYNGEEEQKVAGLLFGFACMDPTINPGTALDDMIWWRQARHDYDQLILAGANPSRFGNTHDLSYTRKKDPFWYLEPYKTRGHIAFYIDRPTLVRIVGTYRRQPMTSDWCKQATHSMVCSDEASDLFPGNWATFDNAVHVLRAFKCDTTHLTEDNLFPTRSQRQILPTLRNEMGLIDVHIPRSDPWRQTGEPLLQAWLYSVESSRQVIDGKDGKPGLLDAYFPFLPASYGLVGSLRGDDSNDGIAGHGVLDIGQDRDADPLNLFEGDRTRISAAIESRGDQDDFTRYFAPFDTDGDMYPHYYYASRVRWKQALKNFIDPRVDPDGYHEITVPAMRGLERDLRPLFEEAMNPATPTNKYAAAMLKGISHFQKMYSTLSMPLYLHDCGRSKEEVFVEEHGYEAFRQRYGRPYNASLDQWGERHPEYPGMDAFAHYVLKYVRLLRQIKGVEDPVLVFFCHKAASTCYNFRPGKLCPVIVVSAPAGEGKTYILKVIESLTVEGTSRGENHLSTHGQTASNDYDVFILTDEGGGLLQHKKHADQKSVEINKAAVGGTGTLTSRRAEYIMDKSGRKKLTTVETKVVHNKSYVIGTNLRYDDINPEMAARTWFFEKKSAFLPATSLTWDNITHMAEGIKNWNKLMQICRFSIYRAKGTGYIAEFDIQKTFDIVVSSMTHFLEARKIQPDENNTWNRAHDKMREACIDDMVTNAIATAIHMPGGICYNDDWELTLWKRVSPLLYVTKQVMLWNIMGLKHEWTGDSRVIAEMLKSAMRLGGYDYKEGVTPAQMYAQDTDHKIQWRHSKKYEKNENYRGGTQNRPSNPNDDEGPPRYGLNTDRPYVSTDALNLNYVRIHVNQTTWRAISDGMPEDCRLKEHWIKSHFDRLASTGVFTPPRHPYEMMKESELAGVMNRQTGRRADGTTAAMLDAPRNIQHNLPIPMVEINSGRYNSNSGVMYIAPECIDQLENHDLLTAFFHATMSSKFRPQAFLLPETHPEYRDIMDKVEVTQSFIDAYVDMIDRHTAAKYLRRQIRKNPDFRGDIDSMLENRRSLDNAMEQMFQGGDAGLEEAEFSLNYTRGTAHLTNDWERDSVWVSRKNCLAQINHSYLDDTDKAIILSTPLMSDTTSEQFEEVKRKMKQSRGHRITAITVDLDDYAATERHIACGLPLRDSEGNPIPIQTPQRSLNRYFNYVSGRSREPGAEPLDIPRFNYPRDQLEQRKLGHEAFNLIHDDKDDPDLDMKTRMRTKQFDYELSVRMAADSAKLRARQSAFGKPAPTPVVQPPPMDEAALQALSTPPVRQPRQVGAMEFNTQPVIGGGQTTLGWRVN